LLAAFTWKETGACGAHVAPDVPEIEDRIVFFFTHFLFLNPNTVDSVLTHTCLWTQNTMGSCRVWVSREGICRVP
jgi:hypothetical protein